MRRHRRRRDRSDSLNFAPGWTIPNLLLVVKLSQTGSICIYNNLGQTDVIVDVEGYYS
jgi:hypothetical protein